MADRIAEMIPRWKKCFDLHTLVINADNGPESNGHRTQWLKRLVELSDAHQLTIQLAYYPPYHSEYNPVERLWGGWKTTAGRNHRHHAKGLGLARSMTYRGIKPTVRKITKSRARQDEAALTKIFRLNMELPSILYNARQGGYNAARHPSVRDPAFEPARDRPTTRCCVTKRGASRP